MMKQKKNVSEDLSKNLGVKGILEKLPQPIIIHSAGVVRYVNTAGVKLLNAKSKNVLVGQKVFKFLHPDYHEIAKKRINEIIEKGKSQAALEQKLIDIHGDEIMVELAGVPIIFEGKQAVLVTSKDVTKEKLAKEEVLASERKFKSLAEESPNMIYINFKGRVVYANRPCTKIMRYTKNELYARDFNFMTLIAPEFHKAVGGYFKEHSRGKDVAPYECTIVDKRGGRINVIQNTRLIDYEDGKAILGIITDITNRRESEHMLMESESRFRNLFENTHDLIQSISPKGKFLYVNQAWLSALGYKASEVKNITMFDVIHPESIKHCTLIFGQILRGKIIKNTEATFITKNGARIEVSGNITLHKTDTGDMMTQGIFTDVTQDKLARVKLRKSEERYRTLVEKMNEGVIRIDGSNIIAYVNKRFCDILGFKEKDLVGKNRFDVLTVDSESKKEITKTLTNRNKGISSIYELRHQRKNGDWIWISVNGTPLFDEHGEKEGSMGIVRDISDQKLFEAEIKELNQGLENRVERRTSELEKANTEIKALLREMHHRVKNNLQIVSSLLNMQAASVDDEFIINAFRESQDRIQTMAFIHESLYLNESMSEISVLKYLEPLVKDRIRANANLVNKIALETNFPDVNFKIDTMLPIGLLLNELVTNSLKHAFPGRKKGEITVSLVTGAKGKMMLKYADNGIGFPLNKTGDSTGSLGLILIDSFAMQLDGKIKRTGTSGTCYELSFKA